MSNLCPCCATPLRVYTQTAMMLGRPSYELVECRNPFCDLHMVTLACGQHELLTETQIAGYAKVNGRFAVLAGVGA